VVTLDEEALLRAAAKYGRALVHTAAAAPTVATQVYLIAGQSNADGRGLVTGLPPALQLPQPNARRTSITPGKAWPPA
jgi:hypothetical protein